MTSSITTNNITLFTDYEAPPQTNPVSGSPSVPRPIMNRIASSELDYDFSKVPKFENQLICLIESYQDSEIVIQQDVRAARIFSHLYHETPSMSPDWSSFSNQIKLVFEVVHAYNVEQRMKCDAFYKKCKRDGQHTVSHEAERMKILAAYNAADATKMNAAQIYAISIIPRWLRPDYQGGLPSGDHSIILNACLTKTARDIIKKLLNDH